MNDNKYQELLNKTASCDPATMLLYKVAAVSYTFKSAPLVMKSTAAPAKAAKKTIMDIIMNVLNKGTSYFSNAAQNFGRDASAIAANLKVRPDYKALGMAGDVKVLDKDILHRVAQLLKNPLTIGAGTSVAAGGAAAGAAGYGAYKANQRAKASKSDSKKD